MSEGHQEANQPHTHTNTKYTSQSMRMRRGSGQSANPPPLISSTREPPNAHTKTQTPPLRLMAPYDSLLILLDNQIEHLARPILEQRCGYSGSRKECKDCRNGHADNAFFILLQVNSLYKTSMDERLTFDTITHCFCDGDYCHLFTIAAGNSINTSHSSMMQRSIQQV